MINRKPTVLDAVFSYSFVSGLFLAVWIHTGMDISESGLSLTILKNISDTLGTPSPYIVPAVSVLTTILEGVVILRYIVRIAENGIPGILVSIGGFFGSLSIFLCSVTNVQPILYFGIVLLLIGGITPRFSE